MRPRRTQLLKYASADFSLSIVTRSTAACPRCGMRAIWVIARSTGAKMVVRRPGVTKRALSSLLSPEPVSGSVLTGAAHGSSWRRWIQSDPSLTGH